MVSTNICSSYIINKDKVSLNSNKLKEYLLLLNIDLYDFLNKTIDDSYEIKDLSKCKSKNKIIIKRIGTPRPGNGSNFKNKTKIESNSIVSENNIPVIDSNLNKNISETIDKEKEIIEKVVFPINNNIVLKYKKKEIENDLENNILDKEICSDPKDYLYKKGSISGRYNFHDDINIQTARTSSYLFKDDEIDSNNSNSNYFIKDLYYLFIELKENILKEEKKVYDNLQNIINRIIKIFNKINFKDNILNISYECKYQLNCINPICTYKHPSKYKLEETYKKYIIKERNKNPNFKSIKCNKEYSCIKNKYNRCFFKHKEDPI